MKLSAGHLEHQCSFCWYFDDINVVVEQS